MATPPKPTPRPARISEDKGIMSPPLPTARPSEAARKYPGENRGTPSERFGDLELRADLDELITNDPVARLGWVVSKALNIPIEAAVTDLPPGRRYNYRGHYMPEGGKGPLDPFVASPSTGERVTYMTGTNAPEKGAVPQSDMMVLGHELRHLATEYLKRQGVNTRGLESEAVTRAKDHDNVYDYHHLKTGDSPLYSNIHHEYGTGKAIKQGLMTPPEDSYPEYFDKQVEQLEKLANDELARIGVPEKREQDDRSFTQWIVDMFTDPRYQEYYKKDNN